MAIAESRRVIVKIKGKNHSYPRGILVGEILKQLSSGTTFPPLGAIIHNRLVSPDYPLNQDCSFSPVHYNHFQGMGIYRRSAVLILMEASHLVFPQTRLVIGQSMANGYYFSLSLDRPLTRSDLIRLSTTMQKIVEEDRPFAYSSVSSVTARDYFRQQNLPDKVSLLQYLHRPEIRLVSCGDLLELYTLPLAPSTGLIKVFALAAYQEGFILRFPAQSELIKLPTWAREWKLEVTRKDVKLFNAYQETLHWNKILEIENLGKVNELCVNGEIHRLIVIAETLHQKKISAISDEIRSRRDRLKLVLVAGPSSSGKSTLSQRLAINLQVDGLDTIILNLGNYYLPLSKGEQNQPREADLESLESLDLDRLNRDLEQLLQGKLVQTPIFDFKNRWRRRTTLPLQLTAGKILIVEGIHGLNEKLTRAIPAENKFKVYVSALPQLRLDDHHRIFTADIRLLRRIVRDRKFRNHGAVETLRHWPAVRRGENKNIFPFQEDADVMFNSALFYELGVLKQYAELALLEVSPEEEEYVEADRLLDFLSFFAPISEDDVPFTSILREFIGKSFFEY